MRRKRRDHNFLLLGQDKARGHALLIPIIVTISFFIFIITMYVNNCPANGDHCTLSFLGRLSFQPLNDNPLFGPSERALSQMGGLSSDKVAQEHQIWRPFSCIWLHAGFVHLLTDLLSLLFIGIRFEQEFGCWKVGSIYFLSGIGGSLMSALFVENRVSVGSSGALFGLMGAIIAELLLNWTLYSRKCAMLMTLTFIAVINFIIGLFPHIDNFAHIGGFLFGFLLGFVFLEHPHVDWDAPRFSSSIYLNDYMGRPRLWKMFLWVVSVFILALGYLLLMVLAFKGVNANEKCSWCRNFSCVPSSHWKCGGGLNNKAICRYILSGSTLVLSCEASHRTQVYSGYYSTDAMKQLCSELCS